MKRGNPPVLFQQIFEATCLFDATSSVLVYCGDHTAAKYINSKRYDVIPFNTNKKQYIHQFLKQSSKTMACYDIFKVKVTMDGNTFVFSLPPYKQKPNRQMRQIMYYTQQCMHLLPKVGVIESSDGSINHAIGSCQNWIFDSNLPHG